MAPTKPVNCPTICWMTVVSCPGEVPGAAIVPVTGNSDWMTWAAQSLPGLSAAQLTSYGLVAWANAGCASAHAATTTTSNKSQDLRMTGLAGVSPEACHAAVQTCGVMGPAMARTRRRQWALGRTPPAPSPLRAVGVRRLAWRGPPSCCGLRSCWAWRQQPCQFRNPFR